MRHEERIMKEEMCRRRNTGISKEKERDRDTEIVRQDTRVEKKIGKDQQF